MDKRSYSISRDNMKKESIYFEYDKLDGDKFESSDFKDDIELLPSIRYSNYKLKKTLFQCLYFLQ